jgi:hypothetical protein
MNVLLHVVKNRVLKGAMFGAPVARTIGELDLGPKGTARTTLRVHVLEAREAASPRIGLELATSSLGGFSRRGIPLTSEQARIPNGYLSQAAG